MGMLSGYNVADCAPTQAAYKETRCKPDYEAMIAAQQADLAKHQKFYDALNEYVAPGMGNEKMLLLFGEMHQIIRVVKARIAELIRNQEEDV